MENFITGYPANESAMRDAVAAVLGPGRAERFFDAAARLASSGRPTRRCSRRWV